MDLSCSKSSLRYSSAVLFLHRTSSNNPNIANNRTGQIFELDWNINFYFTNFSTKWFFFILLKWTLFDSTKFTGYPKWVIHRRMGRSQRVANKISGNIFVIQISSATKLKGHLMKNKRCRWGLCISEKQGRTSLQAILANSASSQPCPTTNTSIITNLKTTTTNLTNITIPLYYHHHPSHLPFRLSANNYQRHQCQILTLNMYMSRLPKILNN